MGTSERRKRDKERRRNEIVDAAERIFFSKGYEAATVDDIVTESELSKGTIYIYFNSKEDILREVSYRGHRILLEMFKAATSGNKSGLEKVAATGRAYREFHLRHKNYSDILLRDHGKQKIAEDKHNPD